MSDYQGNLRNVFYYDYYNNLQLGQAIWYNPFGKQDSVIVAGTSPHRFSYNDKELDRDMKGLDRYYYGARYYDPQLGRFMTPDPIKDDWTPYSYVRNNPIAYNDPTGMASYSFTLDADLFSPDNPEPKGPRDRFDPVAEAIASAMPGDIIVVYGKGGRPKIVYQVGGTKTATGENSTKGGKKPDFNLPEAFPDIGIDMDEPAAATFDGKTFTFEGKSYEAVSGSKKYKPIPDGDYEATNLRPRTKESMLDTKGKGWSVDLSDPPGRDLLRIHPDGGKHGTAGCIGIEGDTRQLYDQFRQYFRENRSFTLRVFYGY